MAKVSKNPPSEAQLVNWSRMAGVNAMYATFKEFISSRMKTPARTVNGQKEISRLKGERPSSVKTKVSKGKRRAPKRMKLNEVFQSCNTDAASAFLTREMVNENACVLLPMQLTWGPVASIRVSGRKSDIKLGDYVITARTTVARLTQVLMEQDPNHWTEGCELVYLRAVQSGTIELPKVSYESFTMVLSTKDHTPLWDIIPRDGAVTIDGCLGHEPIAGQEGGWLWCRKCRYGHRQKDWSTQSLILDNPDNEIYRYYTSSEQQNRVMDIYRKRYESKISAEEVPAELLEALTAFGVPADRMDECVAKIRKYLVK